MDVLYFDCFSGISGDMTLGAFLDLGVDLFLLREELRKLDLTGYEMRVSKKLSHGIAGTDVDLLLQEPADNNIELAHYCSHNHSHSHERNLHDIERLLAAGGLNERVRALSRQVFREIAQAEAKVHNKSLEAVHFHEVGAVDSIVDIVGTAICLDLLGMPKVYASPLHEGRGFINCRHGRLPVPVPAVMAMLADSLVPIPLVMEDVDTELVTPTGLALLKCLAVSYGPMPSIAVRKVGYGLGKRETGQLNAMRLVLGTLMEADRVAEGMRLEEIVLLETNIDDMNGEIAGYLMERLLAQGALDVYYTPVYMKKNRPGVMLSVLARQDTEKKLLECLFTESTTLGVRRQQVDRYCLERQVRIVDTGFGMVQVKVAIIEGIEKLSPEYSDCRQVALAAGLPLREVYQMVMNKTK